MKSKPLKATTSCKMWSLKRRSRDFMDNIDAMAKRHIIRCALALVMLMMHHVEGKTGTFPPGPFQPAKTGSMAVANSCNSCEYFKTKKRKLRHRIVKWNEIFFIQWDASWNATNAEWMEQLLARSVATSPWLMTLVCESIFQFTFFCQVGTGSGPFSRRGDVVECDARAICSSTFDLKRGNASYRTSSYHLHLKKKIITTFLLSWYWWRI